MAQCYASMAQICASCINMAQFCSITCIIHQNYGPILCTLAQCCESMAQCYQASICGSLLCNKHQYGCASCNNMPQCCASYIVWLKFRLIICIMHQYGWVMCMHSINPAWYELQSKGQLDTCNKARAMQLNACYTACQLSTWVCLAKCMQQIRQGTYNYLNWAHKVWFGEPCACTGCIRCCEWVER